MTSFNTLALTILEICGDKIFDFWVFKLVYKYLFCNVSWAIWPRWLIDLIVESKFKHADVEIIKIKNSKELREWGATISFIIFWDFFHVLPHFPFTASETMYSHYLQTWYILVASPITDRLKI